MIRLIILYFIISWCYKEFKPKIDEFLNKETKSIVSNNNQNNENNTNSNSDKKENKSLLDNVSETKKNIQNVNKHIETFNEVKAKTIEKVKETYEKFTNK